MIEKIGLFFLFIMLTFSATSLLSDEIVNKEKLFAGFSDNGDEKYLLVRSHDKELLSRYVATLPPFFFDKCLISQEYKEANIYEVKFNTTSNITSHYFVKIKVLYESDLGIKNIAIKILEEKLGDKISWSMRCKEK